MDTEKYIIMVPAHAKVSRYVTRLDREYVEKTAKDMRSWMKTKYKCVGLAHPQIDDNDPMAFFITLEEPHIVILNPKIVSTGVSYVRSLEGCMTYPDREHIYHDRHKVVQVEYEVFKGKKMVKKTKRVAGFLALVYQHEIDHLNGKYCYDN